MWLVESKHDNCDLNLQYKSKKGCPTFQYGILAKFLAKYAYVFGAFLIVFGLIFALCGNKFMTVILFIIVIVEKGLNTRPGPHFFILFFF